MGHMHPTERPERALKAPAAAFAVCVSPPRPLGPTALIRRISIFRYQHFPWKPGVARELVQPPAFDIPSLLALLSAAGVSRCVLVGHNIFYGADNSYLLDAVRAHPDTFRATALLDEHLPAGPLRELVIRAQRAAYAADVVQVDHVVFGPGEVTLAAVNSLDEALGRPQPAESNRAVEKGSKSADEVIILADGQLRHGVWAEHRPREQSWVMLCVHLVQHLVPVEAIGCGDHQ